MNKFLTFRAYSLNSTLGLAVLSLAISLTTIFRSQATTIVSTLTSTTTFNVSGNISATVWGAQQFTTDSQAYTLDQITLLLQSSSNADTSSPLEVYLYSDSSGEPGSQIATFTGDLTPTTPLNTRTAFSYTPAAATNLAASTSYHILLKSSGSGFYNWSLPFLGTVNVTGPGTASSTRESSTDSGASWNQVNDPFLFSVEGTVVPEPMSSMLVCLGGIAFMLRRMR